MKIILETKRLILREMTWEDYAPLAAILRDDETMYAYEGALNEIETRSWLEKNLARYRDDGMGLWAVILKDSGLMIGQAGLTWQEIEGRRVPEVGYLFNRAYWGRGYATEAAVACRDYGFDRLGFDEIYSNIRDTNIASVNVAIRSGMLLRERFIKHYRGVEMPHYAFSVKKGHFNRAKEMTVSIRKIEPRDYSLLEEFLYHAIFIPPGAALPPREIVYKPDIYIYIKNYGHSGDDCGVVAEYGGEIIGAAWTRIIPAFGHLDEETPELAISVLPEYRGRGVGGALLDRLFDLLREGGYRRTSLSVQKKNPAARFYQRMGYVIVRENDEDYIMEKSLGNSRA